MNLPSGAHLLGVPQPPETPRTGRLITFRGCNLAFAVDVDPEGRIIAYKMQIHDKGENTLYELAFDQRIKDALIQMVHELPDIGSPFLQSVETNGDIGA